MFPCEDCGKTFTRRDNARRHQKNACAFKFQVKKICVAGHLKSEVHKENAFVVIDDGVEKLASAFGQKCEVYRVSTPGHHVDLFDFAYLVQEKVMSLIDAKMHVFGSLKVNMECGGLYFLANKDNVELKTFNSKNRILTMGSDTYDIYEDFMEEIWNKMSEFQERDSGKK